MFLLMVAQTKLMFVRLLTGKAMCKRICRAFSLPGKNTSVLSLFESPFAKGKLDFVFV